MLSEQYLTGQDQGSRSCCRGRFLAKESGSVLQLHRRLERGNLKVGSRFSRREITTQREFRREIPDGKWRVEGVEPRTSRREVERLNKS